MRKSNWQKKIRNLKFNLNNFQDTDNPSIFANWNPYKYGLLYQYQFIQYYINKNPNIKTWINKYKKNYNDNAPGIFFNSKVKISYDNLISYEEYSFLKKHRLLIKDKDVIEIGSGYGRTCEMIIKEFHPKSYTIIDLDKVVNFSKTYLKKNLNKKDFSKIKFYTFENIYNFEKSFSLLINIDSFHEMEKPIIRFYYDKFRNIPNFFIKNTVARYHPSDLINHKINKNTKIPKIFEEIGLMNEVINI